MIMKKPFTLLEIIIVIFLITLITGAIGYNMKGALDKGKKFRTEQAIEQLQDLFLMSLAEGKTPDAIVKNPRVILDELKLAKNPELVLKDGWGKPFEIGYDRRKGLFKIHSKQLDNLEKKNGSSHDEEEDL